MSENVARDIYMNLLSAGMLPTGMSGEWEKDKKKFMSDYNNNEDILNSDPFNFLDEEEDEYFNEDYW